MTTEYGHDMWGALTRGYRRRCREAIVRAYDEAGGWRDPIHPVPSWKSLGLLLNELFLEARRRGATEDDIATRVQRSVDWASRRRRDRLVAAVSRPRSEDPIRTAGIETFEEFDAVVDAMGADEARERLKQEARLRAQAQRERDLLRKEG